MKTLLKVVLPLLVLIIATASMLKMVASKPSPESRPQGVISTPVDYITARSAPITLTVAAQGTVSPRLQATLAAEVGGKVETISDQFEAGRFVQKDEILVTLDPTDYEAAVAESLANLRSAQTSLVQAEADAEQAISDLKEVGVDNPSPLARREPQLEQARLRVDSAEAALALAEKNLERSRIRAPFDGQIIEALVDRGDVLANRGTPIGTLYGTATAEILLPLSRNDLLHLSLPDSPSEMSLENSAKPQVDIILGSEAEATRRKGWIDRLAGTADPITRLRSAIALFEDPLNLAQDGDRSIPFGSFVSVNIEGRHLESAFRLPIVALVGGNRIRVIDAKDQLQEIPVEIAQLNTTDFIVTAGLNDGDRVCVTPLETFVPGLQVHTDGNPPAPASESTPETPDPTFEQ